MGFRNLCKHLKKTIKNCNNRDIWYPTFSSQKSFWPCQIYHFAVTCFSAASTKVFHFSYVQVSVDQPSIGLPRTIGMQPEEWPWVVVRGWRPHLTTMEQHKNFVICKPLSHFRHLFLKGPKTLTLFQRGEGANSGEPGSCHLHPLKTNKQINSMEKS